MRLIRSVVLIFMLFGPTSLKAVEANAVARVLDAFFEEYVSVHFDTFDEEISPEIIERAGLKEVYRSENPEERYVVYILDHPGEILLYYFHNGTMLFAFEDGKKIDFGELFSEVSTAKVGYAGAGQPPSIFILDQIFPPKMIEINYMNTARASFDIAFVPNLEKPIYKLASEIIGDLALYRTVLNDDQILSAHKMSKLSDDSYYRKFHDETELFVSISQDVVGVSFSNLSTAELRRFLIMDHSNNLSQSFIPNLADEKMQIVNDRFVVTLSIMQDIRGESLDLYTMPGLTSGARMHFRALPN